MATLQEKKERRQEKKNPNNSSSLFWKLNNSTPPHLPITHPFYGHLTLNLDPTGYWPDTVNCRQKESVVPEATVQEAGVCPQVMDDHIHPLRTKQLLKYTQTLQVKSR